MRCSPVKVEITSGEEIDEMILYKGNMISEEKWLMNVFFKSKFRSIIFFSFLMISFFYL